MTTVINGLTIITQNAIEEARLKKIKEDVNVKTKNFLNVEELGKVKYLYSFIIKNNIELHTVINYLYDAEDNFSKKVASASILYLNEQITHIQEALNIISRVSLNTAKEQDLTFLQTVESADDLLNRYSVDDIRDTMNAMFKKEVREIDIKEQDYLTGIFLYINYISREHNLKKFEVAKKESIYNFLKTRIKTKEDIEALLELASSMYQDIAMEEHKKLIATVMATKSKQTNAQNQQDLRDILKLVKQK